MRIAIVNDVAMAAETLRRIVASVHSYQVAWIARDGQEAVEHCAADGPDLILMDLIMPVMDGVEATRQIMKNSPCAILIVTATVEGNFQQVYAAMGHGAMDVVATPVLGAGGKMQGADALLRKIATVAKLVQEAAPRSATTMTFRGGAKEGHHAPLLVLGASTGGPQALAQILSGLPADFPAGVVVVQHVDHSFAEGLANWLRDRSALPVQIAAPGALVRPGIVWLAATNDHAILEHGCALNYTPEPEDYPYRPSVDVFFKSVARFWAGPGCAVLLTGMGRDGAAGLLALQHSSFHTMAQDEKTSVVYGMPRAAAELHAADEILPIEEIAPRVLFYFQTRLAQLGSPTG